MLDNEVKHLSITESVLEDQPLPEELRTDKEGFYEREDSKNDLSSRKEELQLHSLDLRAAPRDGLAPARHGYRQKAVVDHKASCFSIRQRHIHYQ